MRPKCRLAFLASRSDRGRDISRAGASRAAHVWRRDRGRPGGTGVPVRRDATPTLVSECRPRTVYCATNAAPTEQSGAARSLPCHSLLPADCLPVSGRGGASWQLKWVEGDPRLSASHAGGMEEAVGGRQVECYNGFARRRVAGDDAGDVEAMHQFFSRNKCPSRTFEIMRLGSK